MVTFVHPHAGGRDGGRVRGGVFALVLAGLAIFGGAQACGDNPLDDTAIAPEGLYLGDLQAHGVPTGTGGGATPELGHAICTDIGHGTAAGTKVVQLANLQLNHVNQFTAPQAEMIVYSAVTHLCPQYTNQLKDGWKDGTEKSLTPAAQLNAPTSEPRQ
jgi:uncharacterized protein DUF732